MRTDKSHHTNVIKIDSTFCFTMKDANDFIESKTGTLTRHYKNGIQSIQFGFSVIEIQKIQSLYFEKKLDTLPDNYTPNCSINTLPTFDEEFIINFDGKTKRFIYNSDYECLEKKTKDIVANIEIFKINIINILKEKDKLKGLEHSDIVFF